MTVWLKRLAWCVGAVLLLWVVTWLALPPLLKWQVPQRASQALGRAVTIGDVSFHPWALDLTVNDIAVAGLPAAPEPLLKLQRLHVNLSVSSLFRRAPVIEALELDAPQIRLSRTSEGHYDIDDIIARFVPKADAPSSEPARFALYNVQVRDARLVFDDAPVKRVHRVEALQLALPFISNLPAEVEVKVEPRLSFKLNGTPFDSGAQATPFAQSRAGTLKLTVVDLDLGPYIGYLPAALPVRVTHGSVSADLGLRFAMPQGAPPSVALTGSIGLKDLALTDAAGQPLLVWQRLQLGLRDVQPLARKLAFDALRLDGLQAHVARDVEGRINLLQLAAKPGDTATVPIAASGASAAAPRAPVAPAWQVSLDAIELADAKLLWNDAAVKPAAALQLDGLALSARQVQWPIAKAIPVSLKAALRTQTAGAPTLAEFSAEGPVTDHEAKLDLKLASLSLAALSPYLAQTLVPSVDGRLAAQAQVDWSGATDSARLRLSIANLTLDALALREGSGRSATDALALKQLALGDVQVDLLAHSVSLGSVKLVQPSMAVVRAKDGSLNLQHWTVAGEEKAKGTVPPHGAERASAPASAASAASTDTWRVQVKDFLLDGGQIRFVDEHVGAEAAAPVRVAVTALRVGVQGLEWHGERATAPANLQFSARIGPPAQDKSRRDGAIDYKGRIGIAPLLANGRLRVERFPVHLFAPYVAGQVQLGLVRAEAGYTGNLAVRQLPAGLDLNLAGDVLLGDVHVATLGANADELLSWQALALKGMKVTLKPKARPQVEVGEASLTDFYSRLIVTEQGRFNLQDMARAPDAAASGAGAAAAPAPVPVVAAASSPAADADAGLPLDLKLGPTQLTNGRIDFTDHFVRPNYSAALTELNGRLGGFSSGSREMATLELRGRAEGTALLEIGGQLNPTVKPLALDIRAKATDLELAPLSPYAGKYAGYAIERGKLSMEVAYKIDADGKLDAKNQVVLNQLTFGDRIESKDATKLPVRLAVALLKDRNGVIDINLPVSGSVNDPQFSVGGIILKVIINLLTKAITAPFALLSGGGADDLSVVEFQPGTAAIAPSGGAAIDKVAKALTERPSLKMTVTGAADPASERDAYARAAIESRLIAEQRREALRAGTPAAAASAPVVLGGDERTRLLKQVYKEADIPNKPRNAIGFAKDLPAPEMEALLKARAPVTDDALRELALQRGIAVRDALIAKGLTSERLFLAAPKLRDAGEGKTAGEGAWTPRVQLSLSVN